MPEPAVLEPRARRRVRSLTAVFATTAALILSLLSAPAFAEEAGALAEEPAPISAPAGLAIAGTPTVGKTVTVPRAGWDPADAAIEVDWIVNGSPVAHSSSTDGALSLKLAPEWAGKSLAAELSATADGREDFSTTLTASKIASAVFTSKPKPAMSGAVRVGAKLTASTGTWKPGATFSYRWRVAGTSVSTAKTYTLKAADRGKKITLTVAAKRTGYATVTQTTAAKTVGWGAFTKTPKPKISGTAHVGKKLTAKAGTWSPKATLTYQWLRSGKAIKGATKSTYTLKSADWTKKISVRVYAKKSGYATQKQTSASVSVKKSFTKAGTPSISSSSTRVGSTFTAKAGSWSPKASYSYQWKRNGKAIKGATKRTYKATGADYGTKLTVTVTARSTHRITASRTSKATAAIGKPKPTLTHSGTYRVGTQIKPGRYVAQVKDGCYWERRSSAGSSLSGIISNDFVDYSGQVIVTIGKNDKYFVTDPECGSWTRYTKLGSAKSSAKDGMYVVGDQLKPGTYRATNTSGWGCYWEILSGFGGYDIIENDFTYNRTNVVRLTSNHVGFQTDGCGTWKRIGN